MFEPRTRDCVRGFVVRPSSFVPGAPSCPCAASAASSACASSWPSEPASLAVAQLPLDPKDLLLARNLLMLKLGRSVGGGTQGTSRGSCNKTRNCFSVIWSAKIQVGGLAGMIMARILGDRIGGIVPPICCSIMPEISMFVKV